MRKITIILLFAALSIIFTSCSQDADSRTSSAGKTVNDVLSNQTETSAQVSTASKSPVGESTNEQKADVDLTELNSTMVYSEVYNMTSNPDKYIGKTVRMNGYTAIYKEETQTYYACLIMDATACCSRGIEFVLRDGNYPEENEIITVYGTFNTYKEGSKTYCQLKNAVIET